MAISELQRQLREFVAERNWQRFQTPKNLVMALTGEAGELTEIFQWLTAEQAANIMDDPAQAEHVREEVADVLAYLLRLCDVLGIDPEAALAEKITKNALKYPMTARGLTPK